jgi:putative glycosyltransferase (TIGR04372 family)
VRFDTLLLYAHARFRSPGKRFGRLIDAFSGPERIGRLQQAIGAALSLLALCLGMLFTPLALVLHVAGFRRLTFITSRIGHLAAEPDCFLKASALGELPKRRWFFVAPARRVANQHMLSYWTRTIPVVRAPIASSFLIGMTSLGLMRYNTRRYVFRYDRSQEIYRINARWGRRGPVLALSEEDTAWGEEMLRALGVPAGAWFVCVHAREPGFSPHDEPVQRYRNSDPEALIPAMREIVRRGGWCVRMGDSTTKRLPPIRGVVDYAHHPLRSERLDVVLCAKARFFLGNSSGPAFVSAAFGRPSLRVNVVPMSALGILPIDLSIPKLYWNTRQRRLCRFDEILGTPAASYRFADQYARDGIELRENSSDEILGATIEMFDRLEGRHVPAADEEHLHRRFMSLLGPDDYGYGAASRVAASFLQQYRSLLPSGAPENERSSGALVVSHN